MNSSPVVKRQPFFKSLYLQVLFAVLLGVLLGNFYPQLGADMKPLGDGFIKLIKMIIAADTGLGKWVGTVDFLLNNIPISVIDVFAKGEILQVLLFAILFGFALHRFGGPGILVFDLIEKTSHVLFDIVGTIMKVTRLCWVLHPPSRCCPA